MSDYETIGIETENINDSDDEQDIKGESKADKFKRLASKRTNNVIKMIEGIGKLSTSAYEYTPEQVDKIFDTIQMTLNTAHQKFTKEKKTGTTFTL